MTLHGHALRMLAACAFAVATRLAPASADVITEWNEVATTTLHPASSIVELRALASAHGAAFDAVNGFEGRYTPYLVDVKLPSGASAEAAAAAAIHGVLAALLPTRKRSSRLPIRSSSARSRTDRRRTLASPSVARSPMRTLPRG
jgi:hypothetical protein